MEEALALTEETASKNGLEGKARLRLRLLAEELIGIMRGLAGNVAAFYTIESEENKKFILHLRANVTMARKLHDQLVALSTSGKNFAVKGFMGRIREMIAVALLPSEDALSFTGGPSFGMVGIAGSTSSDAQIIGSTSFEWTLSNYRHEVETKLSKSNDAKEAWDELEKSIVANLADEVRVSVVGSSAEIIIFKTF